MEERATMIEYPLLAVLEIPGVRDVQIEEGYIDVFTDKGYYRIKLRSDTDD